MPERSMTLGPAAVIAIAISGAALPARADLMSACAREITQYCADVNKGRGRISACLAGRSDKIGSACRSEVQAVESSRLMPANARKIFAPDFRAELPAACVAPAARLCPAVPAGDGRVLACLYARSDRVERTCSDEVRATMR